jgi:hypothetical protein
MGLQRLYRQPMEGRSMCGLRAVLLAVYTVAAIGASIERFLVQPTLQQEAQVAVVLPPTC